MSKACATKVVIENQTGVDVGGITVLHQFGDEDQVDQLVMGQAQSPTLPKGGSCTLDGLVRYRVGFGAMTSWDWWIVTWQGGGKLYSTSPSVCNIITSTLVSGVNVVTAFGASLAAHLLATDESDTGKLTTTALDLLAVIVGSIALAVVPKKSKQDYREYMLRESDTEDNVTIALHKDKVEFSSKSGSRVFEVSSSVLL